MGRTCTVCNHKDIEEINRLLLCSVPYRDIARKFGLSKDALARHKDVHIPELLSKSNNLKALADEIEQADIHKGDNYLQLVIGLQKKALDALEQQNAQEDPKSWAVVSRESRGYLELLGKALDRIRDAPPMQVNILVNPEWIALRTTIISALQPYPEARKAVIDAIK